MLKTLCNKLYSHNFKLDNMVCKVCYVTRDVYLYITNPQILYSILLMICCTKYVLKAKAIYNAEIFVMLQYYIYNRKLCDTAHPNLPGLQEMENLKYALLLRQRAIQVSYVCCMPSLQCRPSH